MLRFGQDLTRDLDEICIDLINVLVRFNFHFI